MPISYVTGNLVELAPAGRYNVIVHGANCFHMMRSGVAKALVAAWPQVAQADVDFSPSGDPTKLGCYSQAYCDLANGSRIAVINGYTQYGYGYDNARYVEYCAVANDFNRLAAHYREVYANPFIGIPRIGTGRAGGEWSIIEHLINKAMPDFRIEVVDLPTPETWNGRTLDNGRSVS